MNRVGDMGLSIGFFALFALFGSLDYATIFSLVPFMNEIAITIIGLLLLTGAMAKSAGQTRRVIGPLCWRLYPSFLVSTAHRYRFEGVSGSFQDIQRGRQAHRSLS